MCLGDYFLNWDASQDEGDEMNAYLPVVFYAPCPRRLVKPPYLYPLGRSSASMPGNHRAQVEDSLPLVETTGREAKTVEIVGRVGNEIAMGIRNETRL